MNRNWTRLFLMRGSPEHGAPRPLKRLGWGVAALALVGVPLVVGSSAVAAGGSDLSAGGLEARSVSDGVELSWDEPVDLPEQVTGYRILRRRPSLGEYRLGELVADTGSTLTTYLDTDVTSGTRYIYRVMALRDGVAAPWSRTKLTYQAPAVSPKASEEHSPSEQQEGSELSWDDAGEPVTAEETEWTPQQLSATGLVAEASPGFVVLTWDAPEGDADAVDGYEILRRRTNRGERVLLTLVADTGTADTSYVDRSANEEGVKYAYRVKALRDATASVWSPFTNAVGQANSATLPKGSEPGTTDESEPAQQLRTNTDGVCTADLDGTTAELAVVLPVNNGSGALANQHLHSSAHNCEEHWYKFTISGAKGVAFTATGLEDHDPRMYLYADEAGTLLIRKSAEMLPTQAVSGNYNMGFSERALQARTYWLKIRSDNYHSSNIYDLSWTRRVLEQLPDESSLNNGIWATESVSVDHDTGAVPGSLVHGPSRDDTDWYAVTDRPAVVEEFELNADGTFRLDRYGNKIPVYVVLWVSLGSDTGTFFIVHDSDGNGGGVGQGRGRSRCVIAPFHNHTITGEMFIEVRSAAASRVNNEFRLKVTTTQPTHCDRPPETETETEPDEPDDVDDLDDVDDVDDLDDLDEGEQRHPADWASKVSNVQFYIGYNMNLGYKGFHIDYTQYQAIYGSPIVDANGDRGNFYIDGIQVYWIDGMRSRLRGIHGGNIGHWSIGADGNISKDGIYTGFSFDEDGFVVQNISGNFLGFKNPYQMSYFAGIYRVERLYRTQYEDLSEGDWPAVPRKYHLAYDYGATGGWEYHNIGIPACGTKYFRIAPLYNNFTPGTYAIATGNRGPMEPSRRGSWSYIEWRNADC